MHHPAQKLQGSSCLVGIAWGRRPEAICTIFGRPMYRGRDRCTVHLRGPLFSLTGTVFEIRTPRLVLLTCTPRLFALSLHFWRVICEIGLHHNAPSLHPHNCLRGALLARCTASASVSSNTARSSARRAWYASRRAIPAPVCLAGLNGAPAVPAIAIASAACTHFDLDACRLSDLSRGVCTSHTYSMMSLHHLLFRALPRPLMVY